ncbi:hypothetical protein CRENBAI_007004 [Crenichthys baileyi]|uniref:Uncharacterized protein n=1 Tax=Crenichthys baileyi TaxID=28760 RepID=A0AAV9RTK9_9TELE
MIISSSASTQLPCLTVPLHVINVSLLTRYGFWESGCSSVSGKDQLVDSTSPVYQAVQITEKDQDLNVWGRRSTSTQSKTFQILAHMTRTESSPQLQQEEDEEVMKRSREPSLIDAAFREPSLIDAAFREPSLIDAAFREPSLIDAAFRDPSLIDAAFRDPSLIDAAFREPSLIDAAFRKPSLIDAAFREPSLIDAAFTGKPSLIDAGSWETPLRPGGASGKNPL